ncbi:hypothetical protein PG997_000980 [Apiospora hydei]|uniref:Protein kinase domain-containing protein n=1 Tax=Apiospora hydei TaxID=1337664 RepID=A0ABR1XC69_9PEZI
MTGPFSKQDNVSILDNFKAKLTSEWKYRACHWHNAKSQGGCLRADSENGEWVTHCCTKEFYHTAEIIKWMRLEDVQTRQTNLAALLSAAQESVHHLRNQPGRLGADDLGRGDRRCYILFAILLNLDCGSLIHAFQRCGITDWNLSNERLSNLDTLKEELQGSIPDVNKLLSNFDDMRFMFQHVVMDLHTPTVYSDRQRGRWISPFLQTAIDQQQRRDSQSMAGLGTRTVSIAGTQGEVEALRCYSMALKTFTSENKHVFNREKLNYSAVKGLAGMVQYLGEYEVDEEIDGQRVDRTWNLLLEPPSAFETIVEFWEALSKVAEAVDRIHNLEAHRGHGDSVRYHGWHADIKPDNILRFHGEFKLADLGFAKFRMKDETGLEPKTILSGLTETYGAPETDRRRRGRFGGTMTDYNQKIDIWSLGCVFSVAATWVVLGRQGVSGYEKLRQTAIGQLRASQAERQPKADDAFHDGYDVLEAVTDWHNHLRSSIRKSDTITPKILDLIDDEMLRREPRQRLPSSELILKFAEDIAAARGTHSFQADQGKLTLLSDDIKNAIRQVEEDAERLANLDGEGDTMKALLPLDQGVSDRPSGALLAHNSQQSTRRNKSELLRQAKKSMRLPRRDHIDTSSHFSSRMGRQSFVMAGPTPGGVLTSELRPSPVPEMPLAHHPRERRDNTSDASLPPRIVIGEPQVESPELLPVNRLESQPRVARPLEDVTAPELEATTQGVQAGSLTTLDSIKTHDDPNLQFSRDQSMLGNNSYMPDTPPKNKTRLPSTEEPDALYITTTSPRSPSRNEMTPRVTTGIGFKSPSKQFQIDPNWPICRQLESIRKKSIFKHFLGGNDKHLSSFLVNRDIKFVIDNGGSMRPYWPAMRITLETLASMIGRLDKDGLDIEFTPGKEHNISNAPTRKLLEKFDKAQDEALRPQDPLMTRTDMAMILGQIFIEYLKDTSKPMTLIVFTDGVWEGTYSDKDVETSIVEFLRNDDIRKKFSGLRWFSIEFVSFGEAGVEKLEGLDNDLESKYGIQ